MTEEQKLEKKKSGIIKKIFKWIGLSILTILFLLAFLFEAPPKIFILLLIILAAFTALPKPARKWFLLTAAGVVIALIVWIFLPVNNEGWQPYKYNFDKELEKLQTKYSIPSEENAAIIYNQLMESYDANDYVNLDSDPNIFHGTFKKPWLSKDYPEIANWFKRNQSIIDTLIEISKINKCLFPLVDPSNPESQLNRNSAIRTWSRLLIIAINNDIAEGRPEKAMEKITAILQMAKHQYQQPVMLDILNGISIETLMLWHLNKIVIENEGMYSQIQIIEKNLPDIKDDWSSVYSKTVEYDKLCARTELANYYEVNSKGRIRISRDPWAQLRAVGRELHQDYEIDINQIDAALKNILYPSYLQRKLIKAKTILRWLTMPFDPEQAAEMLTACLDQYDIMAEPDFDWTIKPQNPDSFPTWMNVYRLIFYNIHFDQLMADKCAESNYRLRDSYLRALTWRRGSRLLIAIKKYKNENGKWPESLDNIKSLVPAEALIDPVGGTFDYKNHGENFSLSGKSINIWPQ